MTNTRVHSLTCLAAMMRRACLVQVGGGGRFAHRGREIWHGMLTTTCSHGACGRMTELCSHSVWIEAYLDQICDSASTHLVVRKLRVQGGVGGDPVDRIGLEELEHGLLVGAVMHAVRKCNATHSL